MTEIFFTATDGFDEIDVIRFMALPYDIEDSVLLSTWSQIKSDPENEIRKSGGYLIPQDAKSELQCRLDAPEIDDLENCRPEYYAAGWREACDRIEVVDAQWDATPDDAGDDEVPANIGDLRQYAEHEVTRLRLERQTIMLQAVDYHDDQRCEMWTWHGRADCCSCACRLLDVNNQIPSLELAMILRRYDSLQKMRTYTAKHREDAYLNSQGRIPTLLGILGNLQKFGGAQ